MELLHDIPPLKSPNMAETSTTIKQGNGQNESLLAILHAGKELYQEMHRNIFVSEPEIAERLRNRGEQFISNLIIACRRRHLEQNRDISDVVYNTVTTLMLFITLLFTTTHARTSRRTITFASFWRVIDI
jgi:hypothetical protein